MTEVLDKKLSQLKALEDNIKKLEVEKTALREEDYRRWLGYNPELREV